MNRTQVLNFTKQGDTVSLSATDSTSRVQFAGPQTQDKTIAVWNSTSEEAFIEIGDSTVNAVLTTSMPIPGGAYLVIGAPDNKGDYIAGICNTAQTTTLYITPGQGT